MGKGELHTARPAMSLGRPDITTEPAGPCVPADAVPYTAQAWHGTDSTRKAQLIRGSAHLIVGREGATFATTNRREALDYAEGDEANVIPVQIGMSRALIVNGDQITDVLARYGLRFDQAVEHPTRTVARLVQFGYDGVVHHRSEDMSDPSDPRPAHTVFLSFAAGGVSPRSED